MFEKTRLALFDYRYKARRNQAPATRPLTQSEQKRADYDEKIEIRKVKESFYMDTFKDNSLDYCTSLTIDQIETIIGQQISSDLYRESPVAGTRTEAVQRSMTGLADHSQQASYSIKPTQKQLGATPSTTVETAASDPTTLS